MDFTCLGSGPVIPQYSYKENLQPAALKKALPNRYSDCSRGEKGPQKKA